MYKVPLGQIGRPPALGNPRSLMHEIYTQSLGFVLESVGVNYLPAEWIRGTQPRMNVPTEQLNPQRRPGAAAAAPAPEG